MATWPRLVFGKLVQFDGGPILPEYEHSYTGKSPDFPQPLVPLCHPSRSRAGLEHDEDWLVYPWRSEGCLLVGPVVADTIYMLAQRELRLPEKPLPGSRMFTQVAYAALPAADWNPGLLPSLSQALQAAPMTREDMEMPPLETAPAGPFVLPDGWLEFAAPLLEVVMSGHAIAVQDHATTTSSALDRFTACLAALPPALSWRVAVGAGLGRLAGQVVLGHGLYASGLRIVDGVPDVGHADISAGREYVSWLRSRCASCRTLEELHATVTRLLPSFRRWDAIDPGLDWQAVAARVVTDLREEHRVAHVEQWLMRPTEALPSLDFSTLARRVSVLEHISVWLGAPGPANRLLPALVVPSWRTAWEAAARNSDSDVVHAMAAALSAPDVAPPYRGEIARVLASAAPFCGEDVPKELARLLLTCCDVDDLREQPSAGLLRALGPTLSRVLLRHPGFDSPGLHADACADPALRWILRSPDLADALLDECARHPSTERALKRKLIRGWADAVPPGTIQHLPRLAAFLALWNGALPTGVAFEGRDAEVIRTALSVAECLAPTVRAFDSVARPSDLGICMQLLPLVVLRAPPPTAMRHVIRLRLVPTAVRQPFVQAAAQLQLLGAPGWRLLAWMGEGPDPERSLDDAERRAIDALEDADVIELTRFGVWATPARFERIGLLPDLVRGKGIAWLAGIAAAPTMRGAPSFYRRVAEAALEDAIRQGVSREAIESLLRPGVFRGLRSAFRRTEPDTLLEPLRLAVQWLDARERAELFVAHAEGMPSSRAGGSRDSRSH